MQIAQSQFLSVTASSITPYVPGEQPKDSRSYIKINTNESPYPPSPEVLKAVADFSASGLKRYPDTDAKKLTKAMADFYGINENQVFASGGSDEALGFSFMAFFNSGDNAYYADITYGFYKVYADLFGVNSVQIPLKDDFTLNIDDYINKDGNIIIANPNAPTGIAINNFDIEKVLTGNPHRLVIIDEAYIDFAGQGSCIKLIDKYENLLVVQTFSKSRALAGMRLGFAFGNPKLIDGLNRIKYSFNPYNIDSISIEVGLAAIKDKGYFSQTVGKIISTREKTVEALKNIGFEVLDSSANFVFAKHSGFAGAELYAKLKEQKILVRHFAKHRIENYLRITIGTDEEMQAMLKALRKIVEDKV